MNPSTPLAVLATTDADYARYGVARERVEPFEDGARTDGGAGTYEWWYFDAQLEDGAKLVVAFMDKDLASPQKPLAPLIRLNLDLEDGRSFEKVASFDPEDWSAATGAPTCVSPATGSPATFGAIASRRPSTTSRSTSTWSVRSRPGGREPDTCSMAGSATSNSAGCPRCRRAL
jgi:hypothetical protein